MHIIGITGPTGCGKTTLLRVIEVHGGFTVDCDALYYEMLRENAPMRAALTEAFGDIFLPDGSLDRPKLGNRVFSDPDALAQILREMIAIAGDEIRNVEDTIPLAQADSRLGWEPSMEYIGGVRHLEWKLRQTRQVMEQELPGYLDIVYKQETGG